MLIVYLQLMMLYILIVEIKQNYHEPHISQSSAPMGLKGHSFTSLTGTLATSTSLFSAPAALVLDISLSFLFFNTLRDYSI